ncbi:MAG: hypothetical protein ABJC89_03960 [Acidobacteriota bacterium]
MQLRLIIGAAVAGAVALIAGVSAQDVRSVPGFGTGIVNVRGTVEVANALDVRASQVGPWQVAIANIPEVRPVVEFAGTGFVTRGKRYDVTWTGGERESVTIEDVGQNGWVRVTGARRRWVNLTNARSVEEM